MIALDTNVVSELMKEHPDPSVARWAEALTDDDVVVPLFVIAELFYGLRRLPQGTRRRRLELGFEAFLTRLSERRLLLFDLPGCVAYGAILAGREAVGRPMTSMDALIAATCQAHGAVLATRNTSDFVDTGIELVNPWEPKA